MNAQPPRILIVGDHRHREFSEPVAWLHRCANLTRCGSLADALSREDHYHGVVLAQARPGQITRGDVERVAQAWPLARLVALLGSWCEGEIRSGDPWPGVTRVYWHQWQARCQRALRFDGPPSAWQLPRTATDVERATHALQEPPPRLDVHLGICTQRALLFRGLADACRATGCQVTWIRRVEDARPERDAAVLWDAGSGQQPDFAQLSELVAAVAPAKIIVLQGFPRFDDLQRARHHGAHHTLALPVQSPDLWSMLQHVVA